MTSKPLDLPADLASAYLALLSEREILQAEHDGVVAERDTVVAERDIAVAQAANAQAMLSDSEALIAKLELTIEKLRRELRGKRPERTARLLDQMELQLEELVMAATEDEVAAQAAAAKTASVRSFTRKRPVRKPWPEDVERKRVVIDPPSTCACCGGSRLSKLGEDMTETLEEIPRRFIVIETVREKFTCRDCEAISQPPAPFPARPNGRRTPRRVAIFGSPFVKGRRAHSMLPAKLGDRDTPFCLAKDGKDLWFAKSVRLHQNLLVYKARENSTFEPRRLPGGLPHHTDTI